MNTKTKKIAVIGMFCALAYVAMLVIKIPVVMFLDYEPKDVVITLCGMIYGPLSAAAVSVVTSLVEMVTVSDTGVIGLLMNVLSTLAFSCTAAAIYKHKRTMYGAVAGLVIGTVAMTVVMLLWNYIVTPMYMGLPRDQVAAMLVPVFLPFNLLKGFINAALTYLLYRPVVKALGASKLLPESESGPKKLNAPMLVVSLAVLVTGALVIMAYNGLI